MTTTQTTNAPFILPTASDDTLIVSLFASRHPLPENQGPICQDFDFATKQAVKTDLWKKAVDHVNKGLTLYLFVTGLTPALTQFLSEVLMADPANKGYLLDYNFSKVILLHHDRETNSYWQQVFI